MKKLLRKVFKLLGLKKNPQREYFKPDGYECLKMKLDSLAKRVKTKEEKGLSQNEQTQKRTNTDDHQSSEDDNQSQSEASDEEENEVLEDLSEESDDQQKRKDHSDKLQSLKSNKPIQTDVSTGLVNGDVKPTAVKVAQKNVYGPLRPDQSDKTAPVQEVDYE